MGASPCSTEQQQCAVVPCEPGRAGPGQTAPGCPGRGVSASCPFPCNAIQGKNNKKIIQTLKQITVPGKLNVASGVVVMLSLGRIGLCRQLNS